MTTNPAAESHSLIAPGDYRENLFAGGSYHGRTAAGRVVASWHDETHRGAFATCSEQPCDAVRRVDK